MRGNSHGHIGGRRTGTAAKPNRSKIARIVRQKRKGQSTNREIARAMGVLAVWVKKPRARHEGIRPADMPPPRRPGRKAGSAPGRREHSAVLQAHAGRPGSSSSVRDAPSGDGINISQRGTRRVLLEVGSAERRPKKSGRRERVRFEKEHSNPVRHTDYKLQDDGGRSVDCRDDASRFIAGHGVFGRATAENAISVLENAVVAHGKPASALADHGSQSCANEKESRKRGSAAFEKKLAELGIAHRLARADRPQTNGKLERSRGELQRKLPIFAAASCGIATKASPGGGDARTGGPFCTARPRDPAERFAGWYNNDRPHVPLDWSKRETPAQAYARKMLPPDAVVRDSGSGERYRTSGSPAGGTGASPGGGYGTAQKS